MKVNKLLSIREYVEMGLNSGEPKHWEAALKDILAILEA